MSWANGAGEMFNQHGVRRAVDEPASPWMAQARRWRAVTRPQFTQFEDRFASAEWRGQVALWLMWRV